MLGIVSPKKNSTAKVQMDKRRAMMTLGFDLNQKFENTTFQGKFIQAGAEHRNKSANLIKNRKA